MENNIKVDINDIEACGCKVDSTGSGEVPVAGVVNTVT
jgi:hypothetical protein